MRKKKSFLLLILGCFLILFWQRKAPEYKTIPQARIKQKAPSITHKLQQQALVPKKTVQRHPHQDKKQSDPQQTFQQILQKAVQHLPKGSDLRKLTNEEVHHFPLPLHQMGQWLGAIKEALEEDSLLASQAIGFYRYCAQQSEVATSVRSLCLANLIQLNAQQGIQTPLRKYPLPILKLATYVLNESD